MNVLLVAPHYPPTYVAGVELYAQRVAQQLAADGHACRLVAVEQLGARVATVSASERDDGGVRVWRLAIPPPPSEDRRASYGDRRVERWLDDLLVREPPDVVHLHSGYLLGGAVLEAAHRARIPVVVTLHDYWFICPRITLLHPDGSTCSGPETPDKCAWCLSTVKRRYRWPGLVAGTPGVRAFRAALRRRPLARLAGWPERVRAVADRRAHLGEALARAARVLSPSRFLRDLMIGAGVAPDRIDLLPYGVAVRPVAPLRTVDGVRVRVGFLGQIAPHKGVHVLVEAVRRLPGHPVELVVRGHLDREPAYVAQLRRLAGGDPRIVFGGPLHHRDLDEFFASIDLLAVPSVWYENSPFVIHEAHMAGLPVLASDLGGMAELVRHDVDGLLAPAGDAGGFAGQIRRLHDDPDLRVRLRQQVRRPPTVADELAALETIYGEVAAAAGRQPCVS